MTGEGVRKSLRRWAVCVAGEVAVDMGRRRADYRLDSGVSAALVARSILRPARFYDPIPNFKSCKISRAAL